MDVTEYHAHYFAWELTARRPSGDMERIAGSLVDAQVDLNPHQVQAALFAFRDPLSKGVILADEVGLGKTIEAGMVLSQKWAERKRKVLIIAPANLRKQWQQELEEKFFLPSRIFETASYREELLSGVKNPLIRDSEIIICSYHFARTRAPELREVAWDLVVIDEAHRLRNVYLPENKTGRAIRWALEGIPKLLLTATPLQNTVLELYGLVSLIDEHIFGDLESFRTQFCRVLDDEHFEDLRERLKPVCHRTLRRQVLEYISYTNRIPLTEEFTPTAEEQELYEKVTQYLRRENLFAIQEKHRKLIVLVLHKLLASSTFAIAGALDTMAQRLQEKLDGVTRKEEEESEDEWGEELDVYEEIREEMSAIEGEEADELLDPETREALKQEIADLEQLRDDAMAISENAKGKALVKAIDIGFQRMRENNAAEKAIVFTESRRTQEYLFRTLEETEAYGGSVLLFNGTNDDELSREVYKEWLREHEYSGRATGSRSADSRTAIVDKFREDARILLATEAAAEGINLQFCSLIINYDLPWNPQRIEQRIGRCHRYGQKHDVVVINFLNKSNPADKRVYQLLSEKLHLFEGVFGSSDEVLGRIGAGIDFERRISSIYQECRSTEEIEEQFDRLQEDSEKEIDVAMETTRQQLLDNFDGTVHDKLRVDLRNAQICLSKYETLLWEVTRSYLEPFIAFDDDESTFTLTDHPFQENGTTIPAGTYYLGSANREDMYRYRMGHPLAQKILTAIKKEALPPAEIVFDYSNHTTRLAMIEALSGKTGSLGLFYMTIESLETQDVLQFVGLDDEGNPLDEEQGRRLFSLFANVNWEPELIPEKKTLQTLWNMDKQALFQQIHKRNAEFFDREMDKLDRWANDKRRTLQSSLKEIDGKRRDLKKALRESKTLEERVGIQKKLKILDAKRNKSWKAYDEDVKQIDQQKDEIINTTESRLQQKVKEKLLFSIRWRVV